MAVQAKDAVALRQCLDSASALDLLGEELNQAAHVLWTLEAQAGSVAELRRATARGDSQGIEVALNAAEAAGAPTEELVAGARALRELAMARECLAREAAQDIALRDAKLQQLGYIKAVHAQAGYPVMGFAGPGHWAAEACSVAAADLRRAVATGDPDMLQATLKAAIAAGVPEVELDAASKALQASTGTLWRFSPADGKHVDIRAEPTIEGRRTRERLQPGELFRVATEQLGQDGILYLRLADGRGWVFEQKPGVGLLCTRYGGTSH